MASNARAAIEFWDEDDVFDYHFIDLDDETARFNNAAALVALRTALDRFAQEQPGGRLVALSLYDASGEVLELRIHTSER